VRGNAHQDFPREGGQNVPQQRLIMSVPANVFGVSLFNKLFSRLYLNGLGQHLVSTKENVFMLHHVYWWQNMGVPEPVVGCARACIWLWKAAR
jgi:hypothetical protein